MEPKAGVNISRTCTSSCKFYTLILLACTKTIPEATPGSTAIKRAFPFMNSHQLTTIGSPLSLLLTLRGSSLPSIPFQSNPASELENAKLNAPRFVAIALEKLFRAINSVSWFLETRNVRE